LKPDDELPFSNVLLSGFETQLMLCYLFLYNAIDIYTQQTWLAIVVVYVVDLTFLFARRYFGFKNVAAKTMVDQRFLV
jgi:hypothetical protein